MQITNERDFDQSSNRKPSPTIPISPTTSSISFSHCSTSFDFTFLPAAAALLGRTPREDETERDCNRLGRGFTAGWTGLLEIDWLSLEVGRREGGRRPLRCGTADFCSVLLAAGGESVEWKIL